MCIRDRFILLQEYDFEVVFTKGKDNVVADTLSRLDNLPTIDESEDQEEINKMTKVETDADEDNEQKLIYDKDHRNPYPFTQPTRYDMLETNDTLSDENVETSNGVNTPAELVCTTVSDKEVVNRKRNDRTENEEKDTDVQDISSSNYDQANQIEGFDEIKNICGDTISKPLYCPDRIRCHQRRDPELIQLILYKEENIPYSQQVPASISKEHSNEFFLENGILYKETEPDRPYNPDRLLVIPKSLRKGLLYQTHDAPLSAHLGIARTYEKIKSKYFWPNLYTIVKDYVTSCKTCSKRKRDYGKVKGELMSIKVGLPFEIVSVDLTGPFPVTTKGNRWIVVFQDLNKMGGS